MTYFTTNFIDATLTLIARSTATRRGPTTSSHHTITNKADTITVSC